MATFTIGEFTLDESYDLQDTTGAFPATEDNDDNDVDVSDLPTMFSKELYIHDPRKLVHR